MNATLEIKKSVNLAVDVLLKDSPFNEREVSSLRTMGFTSSENVRDYEDHGRHHHLARQYAIKYPLWKFITAHQLDKVREKFKLREDRLDKFKGAIPEKNVRELMDFKIDATDIDTSVRDNRNRGGISSWATIDFDEYYQTVNRIIGGSVNDMRGLGMSMHNVRASQIPNDRRTTRDNYGVPGWSEAFERNAKINHPSNKRSMMSFTDIAHSYPQCLKITAEPELFNAPDPDLDPIVTVAVNGGFLIASAWGAEAGDTDVTNQRMN